MWGHKFSHGNLFVCLAFQNLKSVLCVAAVMAIFVRYKSACASVSGGGGQRLMLCAQCLC